MALRCQVPFSIHPMWLGLPCPTFLLSVPHHVSEAPFSSNTQLYLRAQSCPTLCDSMDGSPPGSSVDGIFQARILEWVAISYTRNIQLAPSKIFSTRSPSSFLHCKRRLFFFPQLSVSHTRTDTHRHAHARTHAQPVSPRFPRARSGPRSGSGRRELVRGPVRNPRWQSGAESARARLPGAHSAARQPAPPAPLGSETRGWAAASSERPENVGGLLWFKKQTNKRKKEREGRWERGSEEEERERFLTRRRAPSRRLAGVCGTAARLGRRLGISP